MLWSVIFLNKVLAPQNIFTDSNRGCICLSAPPKKLKKINTRSPYFVYHVGWSSTLFCSLCVAVWHKASELTAETLGLGDISPRAGSNFSWHSIGLKWMEKPECAAHILRLVQRKTWDFLLQSIRFFFPRHCNILLKLYSRGVISLNHVSKHLWR